MLYIIRDIIFAILTIIGLVEIIRMIILWFLHSPKEKSAILIIPIKEKTENIEQILRSAAAKVNFLGEKYCKKIICLDCGADDETKKICEKFCKDYTFIEYEKKEDFLLNI